MPGSGLDADEHSGTLPGADRPEPNANAPRFSFIYDSEHQRLLQIAPEGTTTYLPTGEKFRDGSGTIVWHTYVTSHREKVAEIVRAKPVGRNATGLARYFVNDWQGSVSAVIDRAYTREQDSYDAWGKRRFPLNYADDTNNTLASATVHGYTNQEHLSDVQLIDLNARVYDPFVGQFLSADPVVRQPYDLQSWNAYAYARNNPVAYTDPSGMCFLGCFWKQDWFAPLVAIAAAVTLQEWALPALEGSTGLAAGDLTFANVVIAGAASGAISSQNFQGALFGALEAGAFYGVGDLTGGGHALFGTKDYFENVGAHALVGGTFSVIEGGKFGSGALAAGFASAAGPYLDAKFLDLGEGKGINIAAGTTASAAVGGTASVLGGGKFANGAETGAFGYLFNQIQHQQRLNTWDSVVRTDVAAFNSMNGASPGDAVYLNPALIEAQIQTECGSDSQCCNSDPMQVNNYGDWDPHKADFGLTVGQSPGPALSIQAGLQWLDYKSYYYNAAGVAGPFLGYSTALSRYNGGGDPNYVNKIMNNYNNINAGGK